MSERRLREVLHSPPSAREAAAGERAWAIVGAARPTPRHRRAPRPVSVLALAVALSAIVVASLPAPRDAVAEWVRAAVRAVVHDATPVRGQRLPGGGRLLGAGGPGGLVVFGGGQPAQRLLGAADEATWSAHGRFVAAARGRELVAVDLRGQTHWALTAPGTVRHPRWDPRDGFRVAYLSAGALRIVNGDGSGDRPIGPAGAAAPAWRPHAIHQLAYVDATRHLVLLDVDGARVRWRSRQAMRVAALTWAPDGRRLLAVGGDRARLLDANTGAALRVARAPAGTTNVDAAFAPTGDRYALLRADRAGGTRVLVSPGRTLLAVDGALHGLAWSPDGRWLAVGAPDADAWFLLHPRPGRRTVIREIGAVGRRYGAGAATGLQGWAP